MITEKSLQCDLFALSWQNQHRYIQMKKRRDQIRSTNQKFLQISLKIEIEIVPYRCIQECECAQLVLSWDTHSYMYIKSQFKHSMLGKMPT